MIHEVKFSSYNQRDEVYGWIYVPAAEIKGVIQLVHGFGEHSYDLQIHGCWFRCSCR